MRRIVRAIDGTEVLARRLSCTNYSAGGQAGATLHKRVYDARLAGRFAESICLATANVATTTDPWLLGASHFEMSNAWHGLGCDEIAITEVGASLKIRPHGRSGWKETCDWCKQLGAGCTDCIQVAAPCPSDSVSRSLLATALKTSQPIDVLKCATGIFPDAGWVFVAWVGQRADVASNAGGAVDDGKAAHLHHTVVRNGGALIADEHREATWHERNDDEQLSTTHLETVDFDGDGTSEILEETEYSRRGWTIGNLTVFAKKRSTLETALTVQTSYDDSGMDPADGHTGCTATWSVADGAAGAHELVVASKSSSGPEASAQCVKGTSRYVMRAGKLAKAP